MPSSVGKPPPDRFPTGKEGRGPHNEGWCNGDCKNELDNRVEQALCNRNAGIEAASGVEGCDGGTFDLYSGLNNNPLCSGYVEEKGNQLHDKLEEDGEEGCLTVQKEWWEGEGQGWKGGGSDNGDCDSECHNTLWCREGARERCTHGGSKNEQGEGEVVVERNLGHRWWEELQLGRERRVELALALEELGLDDLRQ